MTGPRKKGLSPLDHGSALRDVALTSLAPTGTGCRGPYTLVGGSILSRWACLEKEGLSKLATRGSVPDEHSALLLAMATAGGAPPCWTAAIRSDLCATLACCSELGDRLRTPEGAGAFAILSPLTPPGGWRGWSDPQLAPLAAVLLCIEAVTPVSLEFLGDMAQRVPPSCCIYVALCVAIYDEAACSSQEILLSAGADDVFVVGPGDPIDTPRLLGAMLRRDALQRVATATEQRVRGEERARNAEQTRHALAAGKKALMWKFASEAFPSIPRLDASLHESARRVGETTLDLHLGGGSSGQVYLGQAPGGGHEVVKVCRKSHALQTVHQIVSLERELLLLRHLPPHPNVIRGLRVLHGKEALYIFMPYCGSLNLQRHLCLSDAPLSPPAALALARQALDGVAHLHANLVAHRDLKGENYVLGSPGPSGPPLMLIDFGLAAVLVGDHHRLTEVGGTHPYTPPEVFSQGEGGYLPLPGDVWALGCLFLELARGAHCLERFLGWAQSPPPLDEIAAALPRLEELAAAGVAEEEVGDPNDATRLLLARAAAHAVRVDVPARWAAPRLRSLLGCEGPGPPPRAEALPGGLQGRALGDLNRFTRTIIGRSRGPHSPRQVRREALRTAGNRMGDDHLLVPMAETMCPLCIPEGVSLALEIAEFPHAGLLRQRLRQAHHCLEIRDDGFDRFLAIVEKSIPGASVRLRRYRDDVLHGSILRSSALREGRPFRRLAPGAAAEVHEAMCARSLLPFPRLDLEAYYEGVASSPLQPLESGDERGSASLGRAFRAALIASGRIPLTEVEGLCRAYGDSSADAAVSARMARALPAAERESRDINKRIFAKMAMAPFTHALCHSDGEGLRRCLDAQVACGDALDNGRLRGKEELEAIHTPLGLTNDHYDTMLDLLEKEGASAQRVELFAALRPWVLGGCRVQQQRVVARWDQGLPLQETAFCAPLPSGGEGGGVALKLLRSKGWKGDEAEALAHVDKGFARVRDICRDGLTDAMREKLRTSHRDLAITHAEFDAMVFQTFLPRLGVSPGGVEAATLLSLRDLVIEGGKELPLRRGNRDNQCPLTDETLSRVLRQAVLLGIQGPLPSLRGRMSTARGRVPCIHAAMPALLLRIIGAEAGSRPALLPAELRRFREIHRAQCGLTVHDFEGFLRCIDEAAGSIGGDKESLRKALLLVGSWLFEPGELQHLGFLRNELTGFLWELGGRAGLNILLADAARLGGGKEEIQAYIREKGEAPPLRRRHVGCGNYWEAFLSGEDCLAAEDLRRIHAGQGVTSSVFHAYLGGMGEALHAAGIVGSTGSLFLRLCEAHEDLVVDAPPAPAAPLRVPVEAPRAPVSPPPRGHPRGGGGCPFRRTFSSPGCSSPVPP